jgi:hypothetical protein
MTLANTHPQRVRGAGARSGVGERAHTERRENKIAVSSQTVQIAHPPFAAGHGGARARQPRRSTPGLRPRPKTFSLRASRGGGRVRGQRAARTCNAPKKPVFLYFKIQMFPPLWVKNKMPLMKKQNETSARP